LADSRIMPQNMRWGPSAYISVHYALIPACDCND
jgi:hypothetical protein